MLSRKYWTISLKYLLNKMDVFFIVLLGVTSLTEAGYRVERRWTGDVVTGNCINCGGSARGVCKRSVYSNHYYSECCKKCICVRSTYYNESGECVSGLADLEGCNFRFDGRQYAMQSLPLMKRNIGFLGRLVRTGYLYNYFKKCAILYNNSLFWEQRWKPLFTNGRNTSDLITVEGSITLGKVHYIKWNHTTPDRYQGLIVKLMLKCDIMVSCVMFKVYGFQDIGYSPTVPTPFSMSSTTTEAPTTNTTNSSTLDRNISETPTNAETDIILVLLPTTGVVLIILTFVIVFAVRRKFSSGRMLNKNGISKKSEKESALFRQTSNHYPGLTNPIGSQSQSEEYELPTPNHNRIAIIDRRNMPDYYEEGYTCPIFKDTNGTIEVTSEDIASIAARSSGLCNPPINKTENDSYQKLMPSKPLHPASNYTTPDNSGMVSPSTEYMVPFDSMPSLHYAIGLNQEEKRAYQPLG